jgi:hypothetical protein
MLMLNHVDLYFSSDRRFPQALDRILAGTKLKSDLKTSFCATTGMFRHGLRLFCINRVELDCVMIKMKRARSIIAPKVLLGRH